MAASCQPVEWKPSSYCGLPSFRPCPGTPEKSFCMPLCSVSSRPRTKSRIFPRNLGIVKFRLPEGTFFVGLTSIYWRVSWKYGLRAFRYANHDIGHAIAALTFAAAGLGWKTSLLADTSSEELAELLGMSG